MDPRLAAASTMLNQERKSEAAELLIGYLSDEPDDAAPKIYSILLNLLRELARVDEGLCWSERAASRFPRDYEIISARGSLLRLASRHAEAVSVFDQVLRIRPGDATAQFNKAQCFSDLGRGKEAEAIFTKLLRQHPRNLDVHRALARALGLQGKVKTAEARLRSLLAANPANVDLWLDLSATAADGSDLVEARTVLDRALIAIPNDARLLRAKVTMLRLSGDKQASQAFVSELLLQYGDNPWLLHELAVTLLDTDLARAIDLLRRATQLAPDRSEYRLALAECLLRQPGVYEGANIDLACDALTALPWRSDAAPAEARVWADILTQAADFAAVDRLGDFNGLGSLLASQKQPGALFSHLARVRTGQDRHASIAQHRRWGDRVIASARQNPLQLAVPRRSKTKIRIGFMSSDLRAHPVSYFAWPLFEHADRDRFEIYAYSWYQGAEADPIQRQIGAMVDVFRWHPSISDRDAAQKIADDQLDILFELSGATHLNKLEVMAWKPAPLCASWLGYPHSAGLDTIDYLLVDPLLNPPDRRLLIEKPLIMPHCWIAMGELAFPHSLTIEPVAPVSRNGFVTFGTANNPYKYNASMLRSWATVMAQVPDARFIFVRPEGGSRIFVRNILAHFEAEGISADRIEFRAVRGDHMKHYNDIDIALDTFPQTGGTTTCEAIWMGVPTITLVGEALFERLSYSILSNAGLTDLCASTPEGFVEIAVRLAGDPARIQALRTGLREQIRASQLGNSAHFARDFYDLVARAVEASGQAASPSTPTFTG